MFYLYLISWLINSIIIFLEFIISFRIVFKMIGASANAAFVRWIYNISAYLINPFEGIFPNLNLGPSIIEPATITAFIVFGVIGFAINFLLDKTSEYLQKKGSSNPN